VSADLDRDARNTGHCSIERPVLPAYQRSHLVFGKTATLSPSRVAALTRLTVQVRLIPEESHDATDVRSPSLTMCRWSAGLRIRAYPIASVAEVMMEVRQPGRDGVGISKSPNVYVPWSKAYAQAVGIPFSGPVLPAQTTCPKCQGERLSVYLDRNGRGNWHYCHDCQSTGDLIQLAAAAWGMQPDTALIRLFRAGWPVPHDALAPARIENYLVHHVQYRHRMRQLWNLAREHMAKAVSPTVARLRHYFRLGGDIEREREGLGQLVGWLPTEIVEAGFCPKAAGTGGRDPGRRYNCNPSAGRVFSGRGWDDVLTIPYYDLPDRLSAFLFVGRRGNHDAGDFVFRPLRGVARKKLREAGIAWLPTILRQPDSRTFVALADPLLALRIHVRHSLMSSRLLPLLAWHDGPEARTSAFAWHVVEGRKVIFWGWSLDHKLLHQAIQAGGYISLAAPYDPNDETITHYISRKAPDHLLHQVGKRAQPWRQALKEWIKIYPDGMVEDLFLRLLAYGYRVEDLCHELGNPPRLVQLFTRPSKQRTAWIGRTSVVEFDGCWYRGPSTRHNDLALISDAIVRLDRIGLQNNQRAYSGRILHMGHEIPFTDVAASTLETKKSVAWLRQVLLDAGRGIPRYYGNKFGLSLFEVARCFQEPASHSSAAFPPESDPS
jgi:hypothetical protein